MEVEHELCNNCKKEIPQSNYVMHTLHCAKRLTLCQCCKEAIPKNDFAEHQKSCRPAPPKAVKKPEVPLTNIEKSSYFQERREVEERKAAARKDTYLQRHRYIDVGNYSTNNRAQESSYSRPSDRFSRTNGGYQTTGDIYSRSNNSFTGGTGIDGYSTRTADRYSRSSSRYSDDNSRGRDSYTEDSKSDRSRAVDSKPKEDYSKTNGHQNGPKARESGQNVIRDTTSVPVPTKPTVTTTEPAKPKPLPPAQPVLKPKPKSDGLLPCRYCDLELPKLELEEHENYCGSRTDKCLECGELVMFKNKNIHMDYHRINGVGPPPRSGWDSQTQRTEVPELPRLRPEPFTPFTTIDAALYSALPNLNTPPSPPKEKGESYKEISRRLDCKTEYIRNLLHDSASITVPLRHNGAVPRNHFNHNKAGPAPKPPRRRNPPTELTVACEFCDTPIPHDDLIRHEAGCRPDLLARRRRSSPSDDDYFYVPPSQPQPQAQPAYGPTSQQPSYSPQQSYVTPQPYGGAPQLSYVTPQPYGRAQESYVTPLPYGGTQLSYGGAQPPYRPAQESYVTPEPYGGAQQAAYSPAAQPSSPEVQLPFSGAASKKSGKQHGHKDGKPKKHHHVKHTSKKSISDRTRVPSRPVITEINDDESAKQEAMIPCEFCRVQIPFDDIIQHETGCRPDLARVDRDTSTSPPASEEYVSAYEEEGPEEAEIPCEFCDSLIPASRFMYHQATCT